MTSFEVMTPDIAVQFNSFQGSPDFRVTELAKRVHVELTKNIRSTPSKKGVVP
jgi:hypothetical protein